MGSLSEAQRSVILGSLLGDGTMRCKTNALLEINHAFAQRQYVDWKFDQLAKFVRTPPKQRPGNGGRTAYRFTTRSLPEFTPFFREFYQSGVKVVPELDLSPLALAVWFMDDGCRSRSAVYFNTQQFSMACQMRLLRLLKAQWAISGTLNRDRSYLRIRIRSTDTTRLRSIIEPHLLSLFEYKLPRVTP